MMNNGNDYSSANDILSDSNTDDDRSGEDAEGLDDNIVKDDNTAVKLLRLHTVIDANNKYDACVASLPCLNSSKLKDANSSFVNGGFPTCGFDKIWSLGLRRRILIQEFDYEKSEWVEKMNPDSALDTDVRLKEVVGVVMLPRRNHWLGPICMRSTTKLLHRSDLQKKKMEITHLPMKARARAILCLKQNVGQRSIILITCRNRYSCTFYIVTFYLLNKGPRKIKKETQGHGLCRRTWNSQRTAPLKFLTKRNQSIGRHRSTLSSYQYAPSS